MAGKTHARRKAQKHRLHKPSGRGVVTLAGKDHYTGTYGSTVAEEKYYCLVAEYHARSGVSATSIRRP